MVAQHSTDNPPVPIAYRRENFDPAPELLQLRDEDTLTQQLAPNGEPVWLVTRHADVGSCSATAGSAPP